MERTLDDLQAEVTRLRETVQVLNDRLETTTRDITVSEVRWNWLAVQPLHGVAVIDGPRLAYVNARFCETFGYGRDEMLNVPAIDIAAHSCRLRVTQYLRDSLANRPRPEILECECLKKDGSTVHIELSSSRTEMGGRPYVICATTDISARKLAERKIQALNRRLAELAISDPLTGLYNRRFMEASLEREIIEAERHGSPLSLVMCDIDHFKLINDTFGHQSGDEVLKAFGSLLKRRCRRSDIACRFGGEEFLVVFPGMPGPVAVKWADKMRAAIAGARVAKGAASLQVTASFGVATYPAHGHSWQELIAAADTAQYEAKAAGRDQVVVATPATEASVADPATLAARAM
jgi:diguanylate cyclase (GGDEF)-like protein/PAS domain S-box-containing protein